MNAMLPYFWKHSIFLRNTKGFWSYSSLIYQELYLLKFILYVKILVNKSVIEIIVLKFIGIFLCFARGVGWGIFCK